MMQHPVHEKQNRIARARLYFICAGVFLFAFAMLWSVDSAIGYILFGLFSFFLALGWINWPWEKSKAREQRAYQSPSPPADKPHPSFEDLLEDVLKKAKQEDQKAQQTSKPAKADDPKRPVNVIRIVSVFVFCIFLVIFFAVFFDSPESDAVEVSYLQQATEYYNSGVYDSALINYKRFLLENPDNTDALFGLGNAYSQLEKPDSAIRMYDRCLAADPTMIGATYNKAWVEYNRKNYSESSRILKALIDTSPDYLDAMQLLGDVYYNQNLYDEALRWYEAAYAKGAKGSWICYVMGYLHQEKGNTLRAVALYKESLTYDTTTVDVYKRLGDLLPGKDGEYYRSVANGTQW